MQPITINYKNFLAGESESNYNPDRGFSPSTYGIEVVRSGYRGLMLAGRSGIEYKTNLSDKILATTQYTSSKHYSIGSAGKIYETLASSPVTHTVKATESVKTYDANSDILCYGGYLFITSTLNVTQCDLPVSAPDNDWWTAVAGGDALTDSVPHKLFEFQGVMYITNGNKLYSWDGSTHDDAAFILPAGWVIKDTEIVNNRIYLAASKFSSGDPNQTTLFIWDGYSPTWIDEKPLTLSDVTAIKQLGGVLFLFTTLEFFYFNGNDAELISYIGGAVNYKKICAYNGQMYFPGTYGIKCYDFKTKGLSTPIHFTDVSTIFIGFNRSINCFTTASAGGFYVFDENNSTDGVFFSDRYFLPAICNIKKVEICFSENLVTNAAYTFALYNENLESMKSQAITYALDGAIHKKVFNINMPADAFYFTLSFENAACKSVRWIKIYYEPREGNTTK
jgi:hypothetical protein